jgi:hypothetical protein
MGVSNGDEDGSGVDGDGSGGNSPSRQDAETDTSVPRNSSSMAAVIRPFCITILYHNLLLFIDIFHI